MYDPFGIVIPRDEPPTIWDDMQSKPPPKENPVIIIGFVLSGVGLGIVLTTIVLIVAGAL